ncbi:hypothetical protein JCGZ_16974 [Jatropha curcas]|uniref:Uncharacterized protein n=1 Tax=Jatropha curcas TaxID=180498 RepID=A0A067K247_JATCU|nr:hypothetical protein JCGZ_16974 [Jatropha curcas]
MSSRKLATVSTSTIFTTTTTTKKEENGGNKADSTTIPIPKGSRSGNEEVGGEHEKFTINSSSPTSEQQKMTHEDNYVDIMVMYTIAQDSPDCGEPCLGLDVQMAQDSPDCGEPWIGK